MNFFDLTILFFFINFLSVVLLFWLITFIGSFFYTKKENLNRNDFYECGFKSFGDLNFNLNTGAFVVIIFVILYDIEITFLIPALLNSFSVGLVFKLNLVILYFIILMTFVIDVYEDVIKWDI